jgi:hypothetical protein
MAEFYQNTLLKINVLVFVQPLSFRDELSHFSGRLAFSMEITVPSRRSVWTGKRCIVRMIGASITENLLKLDGWRTMAAVGENPRRAAGRVGVR